jgi:prepilin-type N-terminal cleavage/methylation domain-containing protein
MTAWPAPPRFALRAHRAGAGSGAGAARRAFTLLEVLVAIGLIGLLAGALALFVDDLAHTRAFVSRATERARGADALLGAVEAALQTAVADGGARGGGVVGTGDTLRILSSRTDAAGADARTLSTVAFAPLCATEVRGGSGGVSIGRAGRLTRLPESIGAVGFRYFDGTEWREEFDSLEAGQLPVLVEVAVWFRGAGDDAGAGDAAENSAGNAADADRGVRAGRARADEPRSTERPPPDRVRVIAVPDALPPREGNTP